MRSSQLNRRGVAAVVAAVCVAIILAPVMAEAGPQAGHTTKVKGTVKVSNFPAVQSISGSVNVGNLPATQKVAGTVNVGNLPAVQSVSGSVDAVPTLPGTPYANEVDSSSPDAFLSYPSNMHFVVQFVSVRLTVTAGSQEAAILEATTGGTTTNIFIPLTLAYSSGGSDYYVGSLQLNLYGDPGDVLSLFPTGSATVAATIFTASGYLTP